MAGEIARLAENGAVPAGGRCGNRRADFSLDAVADPQTDDKTGWHLPGWVRELSLKTLYVVVPLLIVAAVNLYSDNISLKKDVAREAWRNDQQDVRWAMYEARTEARMDRFEANLAESDEKHDTSQTEVLKRLDLILRQERRKK